MGVNLLAAKELQLELSSKGRRLYFHGESMRPFLVEGDEVVVEPIAFDDIHVGDVVTYRFSDKFPTRRVVRKHQRGLDLWCENWPARRYVCAAEDLLGVAVARGRDGEWIGDRSPEWRAARRKALRAWRRIAAREYVVTFPGRVVRKLAKVARRVPA
ncbi:MAG: S24/S26 family peptidase [Gemmatimonadota bacterium]